MKIGLCSLTILQQTDQSASRPMSSDYNTSNTALFSKNTIARSPQTLAILVFGQFISRANKLCARLSQNNSGKRAAAGVCTVCARAATPEFWPRCGFSACLPLSALSERKIYRQICQCRLYTLLFVYGFVAATIRVKWENPVMYCLQIARSFVSTLCEILVPNNRSVAVLCVYTIS